MTSRSSEATGRPTLARTAAREREVPMLEPNHSRHVASRMIQSRQALCNLRRRQSSFEEPLASRLEAQGMSTRQTWTTTGCRRRATTPTMARRHGIRGQPPKEDGEDAKANHGRTTRAITLQTREDSHERLHSQCARPLWRTASSPRAALSLDAFPTRTGDWRLCPSAYALRRICDRHGRGEPDRRP